jgi:hypothetical protein
MDRPGFEWRGPTGKLRKSRKKRLLHSHYNSAHYN